MRRYEHGCASSPPFAVGLAIDGFTPSGPRGTSYEPQEVAPVLSRGRQPLPLAAGWLAEQFMKSQMGVLTNIVLGIIGAAVASWLFGLLGITLGGWIGYLIAGFIGACILIAIARAFSGGFQQRT
jgi:uncharacterized membrane protein YeaQ/YmgE (transglycosylase-associated protein family)